MTMRAAWRWCAAIGIIAFICSGLFGRIPGLVACGPTGGLAPIMAFEFARTTGDIAAMFGSEPCTSTFVAAQKTGLLLDGLGFIPSYTGFLILATIGSSGRGWIRAVVIAALLIAGLSDEIEGFFLNAILDRLPGSPALLNGLWWAVHVKFALLAGSTIAIGCLLLRRRSVAKMFGVLIFTAGVAAFYGVGHVPTETMTLGFLYGWTTLLIAVLTASFWPSLFSPAPAAPPPDQAAPSA